MDKNDVLENFKSYYQLSEGDKQPDELDVDSLLLSHTYDDSYIEDDGKRKRDALSKDVKHQKYF